MLVLIVVAILGYADSQRYRRIRTMEGDRQ